VISSTSSEATALVNFIGAGGRVYLEGGDVWAYDPQLGGYDFSYLFNISPFSDGMSDMGPVEGLPGTFANDMSFTYGGENQFMDRITANGQSSVIFHDIDDYYDCGIAYDAGAYRTVGTSFELGGLIDGSGVSTRSALLDSIMRFFGIQHGIMEDKNRSDRLMGSMTVYPNPFRNRLNINLYIEPPYGNQEHPLRTFRQSAESIELTIYDTAGRLIRSFSRPSALCPMPYAITWSGDDQKGNQVPQGVYFVKFNIGNFENTKKIILVR
jgi:hypothetical protein